MWVYMTSLTSDPILYSMTPETMMPPKEISEVIFHLRDINQAMTNAWEKEFAPYSNTVKVYYSSHSLKKNAIF